MEQRSTSFYGFAQRHVTLQPTTQGNLPIAVIPRTVVLASADASFRQRLRETLTGLRWQVHEAGGGAEALAYLDEVATEAMLLDSWLPDLEVSELAEQVRRSYPWLDLLGVDGAVCADRTLGSIARSPRRNELLHALRKAQEGDGAAWNAAPESVPSAFSTAPAGVGAVAAASIASVMHPHDRTEVNSLQTLLQNADRSSAELVRTQNKPDMVLIPELVGESAAMRGLARLVRLVAPRSATVLLEGETGSGKEVVARALHRLSTRSAKSFVVLNCAAIPEALLEAELFGHTRGAFTGAVQSRMGRIEAADGGTLLLDEIGEMPLGLQAKLLRFLECGELQRVGDNEPVRVNVRVIAATHQPLERHASEGKFRSDLYYRLAVFPIRVPALAERMEDIPLLAGHFLSRLGEEMPVKRLSQAALQKMLAYPWPGNVRELAHVLERAAILAEDRLEILAEDVMIRSSAADTRCLRDETPIAC
ncbi:MAG: sigma 54-interacting transcriptional regulator [Acidobacteriaceae bacterium]